MYRRVKRGRGKMGREREGERYHEDEFDHQRQKE